MSPKANKKENAPMADLLCKAVNCSDAVIADSEYCATHDQENKALLARQELLVNLNQDVFKMEGDEVLTKIKANSVSSLVDVQIKDGLLMIPLPKINYLKVEYPTTDDTAREQLKKQVPYHLLQGKKGATKLATSIERIEQHRDHLLSAFIDVVNAVYYLENGAPRISKAKSEQDAKRATLEKMPDVALLAWAGSLGIDTTQSKEIVIEQLLPLI